MKRCRICHRQLRDAESIRIGIGPVCRSRLHRRKKSSSRKIQESENMTLWELLEGGENGRYVFTLRNMKRSPPANR